MKTYGIADTIDLDFLDHILNQIIDAVHLLDVHRNFLVYLVDETVPIVVYIKFLHFAHQVGANLLHFDKLPTNFFALFDAYSCVVRLHIFVQANDDISKPVATRSHKSLPLFFTSFL